MDGQLPEYGQTGPSMDRPPLRFFRSPSAAASPDVHRVWLDCCLPEIAEMNDILWALDTWARLNCRIEMRQHHHLGHELPYLFWLSPSGVRHECFADTYSHWFICGCIEVKPQATVVPLSTPPTQPLESLSEEEEASLESEAGQLTEEEASKLDEKIDEIRIHSLEEASSLESVSLDDITQLDLKLFLNQGESDNCPTPRPSHNHNTLSEGHVPGQDTPRYGGSPCFS